MKIRNSIIICTYNEVGNIKIAISIKNIAATYPENL